MNRILCILALASLAACANSAASGSSGSTSSGTTAGSGSGTTSSGSGSGSGSTGSAGFTGTLAFDQASSLEVLHPADAQGNPDTSRMSVVVADNAEISCGQLQADGGFGAPSAPWHLLVVEWSGGSAAITPGTYQLYPNGDACSPDGGACNPANKTIDVRITTYGTDGSTLDVVRGQAGSVALDTFGGQGLTGSVDLTFALDDGGSGTLQGKVDAPFCLGPQ